MPSWLVRMDIDFATHCYVIILSTKHHHDHIGPFKDNYFEIEGDEWKKASTDVVIAGLGWISITGIYLLFDFILYLCRLGWSVWIWIL
jgi:hypothetical protein